MERKIDYLLKYISNDVYKKIINSNNDYLLDSLEHNRVDVDLNIRYLVKYGVRNMDRVIYEWLDDLVLKQDEFIKKVKKYEKNLGKEGFISMIENL